MSRCRKISDSGQLLGMTFSDNTTPAQSFAYKAADGCKADWTHAQRAPRGESAVGRARINRKTAQENAEEVTSYEANALNQYTAVGAFVPEFDADGKAADGCKADWTHVQRAPRRGEGAMGRARINQTKVQTSTGIWNVTYNAENRPIEFSRVNPDGTTTRVTCAYDHMGRRATKKVETIATDTETEESTTTTTLHQRYLYRGYLQIACCDLAATGHPCLWFITWDPSQPVATRPLAIRKDGTWYAYGWDLTKNVCEVFSHEGTINNTVTYSYTPYGAVIAEGNVQQPLQWSSEFHDEELGLVYYNYRHYNPADGRWLGRDNLQEIIDKNIYCYANNKTISQNDSLGNAPAYISENNIIRMDHRDDMNHPGTNIAENGERYVYGITEVTFIPHVSSMYKKNAREKRIDLINPLIDDSPYIDVTYFYDKSYNPAKPQSGYHDRLGNNVIEHEEIHVKIEIEEWKKFVDFLLDARKCFHTIQELDRSFYNMYVRESEYNRETNRRHDEFEVRAGSSARTTIRQFRTL